MWASVDHYSVGLLDFVPAPHYLNWVARHTLLPVVLSLPNYVALRETDYLIADFYLG